MAFPGLHVSFAMASLICKYNENLQLSLKGLLKYKRTEKRILLGAQTYVLQAVISVVPGALRESPNFRRGK